MLARSGWLGAGSANAGFHQNSKTSIVTSTSLPRNSRATRNLTMARSSRAGHLEPMGRSSLRPGPKDGAISALAMSSLPPSMRKQKEILTPSQRRWKAFRNICRTIFEFMFTQIGIGGLVIAYTIVGAFIFQQIELSYNEDQQNSMNNKLATLKGKKVESIPEQVVRLRISTINEVWKLTEMHNIFNRSLWTMDVATALFHHQEDMVSLIQQGYEEQTLEEKWSFPAALMFTLSVVTMIGYGNTVPKSDSGKLAVIFYAMIGIPVYIFYLMNMGKIFARFLKWIYTKAYRWNVRRKWRNEVNYRPNVNGGENQDLDEAYLDELEKQVIVPSTTCLWVMIVYLLIGTILFAEWEGWNYVDSVYFCVTSLAKIGFGDFVPGRTDYQLVNLELDKSAKIDPGITKIVQIKLVITFVYILFGMAIVAMCYHLLKEDVLESLKRLQEAIRKKAQNLHEKYVAFFDK